MLSWVALDTDSEQLELVLEHTESWFKLGTLMESLVERNRVEASVELEILGELWAHLLEEERVVQRQPPRP